jgi:hypothetical protein
LNGVRHICATHVEERVEGGRNKRFRGGLAVSSVAKVEQSPLLDVIVELCRNVPAPTTPSSSQLGQT